MLEFDVETRGLQWYAPSKGMFLAQFLPSGSDIATAFEVADRPDAIQDCLDAAELHGGIQAWNSKFDLHHARAAGFTLPPERLWHDAMVKAHICDERFSVALKAVGSKLFGEQESDLAGEVHKALLELRKERRKAAKEAGTEYEPPTYEDVDRALMVEYGKQDVILQRKVAAVHDQKLKADDDLREVYELERGVLAGLFWMEERGLPIDRDSAVKFEAQVLDDLDAKFDRCVELAGIETFNPRSPKQVSEALERRGADTRAASRTAKGLLRTDEENLRAIDDELAIAMLDFRSTATIFDRYLKPMLHRTSDDFGIVEPFLTPENRIHSSFNQVGARTGRMSSSMPNVQNWHRDDLRLRYLVQAPPGYKLVTCDLDAIELKLFAGFCGTGALLDAVKRGEDMHVLTAANANLEDHVRADGSIENSRQRGKKLNYLIAYAGGVTAVRKWFGQTAKEAKATLGAYHAAYPEVQAFQNKIEFALSDRGFVKSPWGRKHRPYDDKPVHAQAYKFVNYLVQGTAADLLKDALVQVHAQGVPLIAAVHDELVACVPEEDAAEAAHIIETAMCNHPRLEAYIPITAEAQICDRWSDAKPNKDGSLFVPDYIERG